MRTLLLAGTLLLDLFAAGRAASANPIVGCSQNSICFADTGSLQTWTVPANGTGTYDIVAIGAQGGAGGNSRVYGFGTNPGYGARLEGDVASGSGDVLNITVGASGSNGVAGGGGGDNFMINKTTNPVLMAAGGGGGTACQVITRSRQTPTAMAAMSPSRT